MSDDKLEKYRQHVEMLEQSLREQEQNLKASVSAQASVSQQSNVSHHSPVTDEILHDYPLRDTDTHTTEISDVGDYDIFSVYVTNELDADVTVTVYGNREPRKSQSARIGESFTVKANDVESRNVSVYSETWTQYVYCTFKASTAPTKGLLHIYVIKRMGVGTEGLQALKSLILGGV